MTLQHKYHIMIPVLSILLLALPSFVSSDHHPAHKVNTHPSIFDHQKVQRKTQLDSSLSPSDVSYDTNKFEDDTLPAAFNWDSTGVSFNTNFLLI